MTDSGYDLDAAAAAPLQANYEQGSTEAAKLPNARLDFAYGSHARQRLDVFSAGPEAPTIVFFHGGYWKAGSKDSRRFPAKHWNTLGISWVPVNYRLTPDNALADCVADARAAVAWLSANADATGIDPSNLHIAGNSAGGQSGGNGGRKPVGMMDSDRKGSARFARSAGCLIYTRCCRRQPTVGSALDEASARTLSPQQHLPPPDIPVLVGCGGAETAAFKDQSRNYAQLCRQAGNPLDLFESPVADHFRIIGEFGVPGSPLFDRLKSQIGEGVTEAAAARPALGERRNGHGSIRSPPPGAGSGSMHGQIK